MQSPPRQNFSRLSDGFSGNLRYLALAGKTPRKKKAPRRNGHAFRSIVRLESGLSRASECLKGTNMKDSTKDQVEGKAHEVKGAVKEKIGHAVNNPDLEQEGQGEKVGGKVQKKVGQVEKVLGA